MQQIGQLAARGLPTQLLEAMQAKYPQNAELIRLNSQPSIAGVNAPDASLLILRNGVNLLMSEVAGTAGIDVLSALYQEQTGLEPDKKAKMRGRVVNKRARYNLCFSAVAQAPDYEQGKGTVVSWAQVPWTRALGVKLAETFGTAPLQCEGNYYYDTDSVNIGIGYHSDMERSIVIGVRMGVSLPLRFRWFENYLPISEPIEVILNHGDIYVMSEKAVGFDGSKIMTLRHTAGTPAYLEKEEKRITKKAAERQGVATRVIVPVVTPSVPVVAPTVPVVAPTVPVVTPTVPVVTPTVPVVTPTVPVVTPTVPVVTPTVPVVTPTVPVIAPTVPS